MTVFVNRTLNLKKIKAIGFDMDYTLVRYNTENFERLVHQTVVDKLVQNKKYPEVLRKQVFDIKRAIQGLVIDKRTGNILKLSRYGKVKSAYHGTQILDFKKQQEIYAGKAIDLSDSHIKSLDTSFSLTHGVLYAQLVDLKNQGLLGTEKDYDTIAEDLKEAIDMAHSDGSVKDEVFKNSKPYIIQDPSIPQTLERLKKHDKKLLLITNSDYPYCRHLMDYAFNPFLKEHKHWKELFELVIVRAAKPNFFISRADFLKIDPDSGMMSNYSGPTTTGLFQGGCAERLEKDFKLDGEEFLYLGDHIFGDVLTLKKHSNWRTGLIVEPLIGDLQAFVQTRDIQKQINQDMETKEKLEKEINDFYDVRIETGKGFDKSKVDQLFQQIEKVDEKISANINEYTKKLNPYWGELMRAGSEESFFMGQVEKYACIYMSKISDLNDYSPRTYFRPRKRVLAHEQ
ncbi:MAG: HAD-IG family 5'-nucleotidase [Pseudomonadota bacterium]